MPVLAGPLFAAAALLGSAGCRKLVTPDPTRIALRTAGLRGSRLLARAMGAGEVTAAVVAFVFGGRLGAALITLAYLAFAGFTRLIQVRGGPGASCGCFGASDPPVTSWHVGVDLAIAAVAAAAIAFPVPGIVDVARTTPLGGVIFVGYVVLLAWLLQILLTALPAVWAAANPPRRALR